MIQETVLVLAMYMLVMSLITLGYEQGWLPEYFGQVEQTLEQKEADFFK